MQDFKKSQVWQKSHDLTLRMYETEYLILLARDLKYLDTDLFAGLMDTIIEVRKMLTSLLRRLKTVNC
jgi:hypothetical protein